MTGEAATVIAGGPVNAAPALPAGLGKMERGQINKDDTEELQYES